MGVQNKVRIGIQSVAATLLLFSTCLVFYGVISPKWMVADCRHGSIAYVGLFWYCPENSGAQSPCVTRAPETELTIGSKNLINQYRFTEEWERSTLYLLGISDALCLICLPFAFGILCITCCTKRRVLIRAGTCIWLCMHFVAALLSMIAIILYATNTFNPKYFLCLSNLEQNLDQTGPAFHGAVAGVTLMWISLMVGIVCGVMIFLTTRVDPASAWTEPKLSLVQYNVGPHSQKISFSEVGGRFSEHDVPCLEPEGRPVPYYPLDPPRRSVSESQSPLLPPLSDVRKVSAV